VSVFDRIRAALKSNLDGLLGRGKSGDTRKVAALEADLAAGRRELELALAAERRLEQQGLDKVALVRKLAVKIEQAARVKDGELARAALAQKKRAEDETRALAKVLTAQRKETDALHKMLAEFERKLGELRGDKVAGGAGGGAGEKTGRGSGRGPEPEPRVKRGKVAGIDLDDLPDLSRFDVGDELDQADIAAAAEREVEEAVRAGERAHGGGMTDAELKSRRMDLELERLKQKMRGGGAAKPASKAKPSSDPLADLKKKLDRK